MSILVTGAAGFIGTALVERLLAARAASAGGAAGLILVDRHFGRAHTQDPRVRTVAGDVSEAGVLAEALREPVEQVFHLASVPGGLAEMDFALGLKVNLEGTLRLLEALRAQGRPAVLVMASSIAVYGLPLPEVVDEDTPAEPALSYGAHKLAAEILLRDYSRRGHVDGRALRLPGVVARPRGAQGLRSAFLSELIRALAAGESYTCPVSADAHAWLISLGCAVDNLLHAARLEAHPVRRRTWLSPALRVSMRELVAAVAALRGPAALERVRYAPDEALEAQFAAYPPLRCPQALAAGFRADASATALVQRALEA